MATYLQIPPDAPLGTIPNKDCCCENPLNIGCYSHCAVITLDPIYAPEDGDYELIFTVAGNKKVEKKIFATDDIITFQNPFEEAFVQLVIMTPSGEKITISATEPVTVGCETTDVTTIYDCFVYTSKIQLNIPRVDALPCDPAADVTFGNLVWVASDEHNHQPVIVTQLYIESARKTTYRIYYTPNAQCLTDNTTPVIVPIFGYTITDVLNVSDEFAGNYIQFSIVSSLATGSYAVNLGITGLCGSCAPSKTFTTNAVINQCTDPLDAEFIGMRDSLNNLYATSYTVPDDVNNFSLWIELFRRCCRADIDVSVTILTIVNGFNVTTTTKILSGYSDCELKFNVPEGLFSLQINVEISGSCITTQNFNFDIVRT